MKERRNVRQIPGEAKRRWFFSDEFDLIVWLTHDERIAGFELCYDKRGSEKSISWRSDAGFRHMAVDDGEQRPGKYKATPILVSDGLFDATRVHADFLAVSHSLPEEIAGYVLQALRQYPADLPVRGQVD